MAARATVLLILLTCCTETEETGFNNFKYDVQDSFLSVSFHAVFPEKDKTLLEKRKVRIEHHPEVLGQTENCFQSRVIVLLVNAPPPGWCHNIYHLTFDALVPAYDALLGAGLGHVDPKDVAIVFLPGPGVIKDNDLWDPTSPVNEHDLLKAVVNVVEDARRLTCFVTEFLLVSDLNAEHLGLIPKLDQLAKPNMMSTVVRPFVARIRRDFNIPERAPSPTDRERFCSRSQVNVTIINRHPSTTWQGSRTFGDLNATNGTLDEYLATKPLRCGGIGWCHDEPIRAEFTVLYLEHMSFREALEIVTMTDILIGSHGAGLSISMFLTNRQHMTQVVPESISEWGVLELFQYCAAVGGAGYAESYIPLSDVVFDTLPDNPNGQHILNAIQRQAITRRRLASMLRVAVTHLCLSTQYPLQPPLPVMVHPLPLFEDQGMFMVTPTMCLVATGILAFLVTCCRRRRS